MRDPKERESETILDVVEIELLPYDALGKDWGSPRFKSSHKSHKSKMIPFLAAAGLNYLDEEEKAFFGFTTRKSYRHRNVVGQDCYKAMKAEIVSEAVDMIKKFKDEMDRNFLEFQHSMVREFSKRQRHQMKKLDKLRKKRHPDSKINVA